MVINGAHLLIFALIFVLIIWRLAVRAERKQWNRGCCPHCGSAWIRFDIDSQGGRGYKCAKQCGASVWIKSDAIDGGFIQNQQYEDRRGIITGASLTKRDGLRIHCDPERRSHG